jgi:hypothetical protein
MGDQRENHSGFPQILFLKLAISSVVVISCSYMYVRCFPCSFESESQESVMLGFFVMLLYDYFIFIYSLSFRHWRGEKQGGSVLFYM